MLRLPRFCLQTKVARFLGSSLNFGPTQSSIATPSVGFASSAGCQMQLVNCPNASSTGNSSSIPWCHLSSMPLRQGRTKIGFIPTMNLFSTSTQHEQTKATVTLLEEVKAKEYVTLYLNSKIRLIRLFCIAAKVTTLTFILGAPVTFLASVVDLIALENATQLAGLMGFYSLLFTGQSYVMMSKIVCKIMLSEDHDYLKLSHLSVFGNRRDIYTKVTNILPISGSLSDRKFNVIRFRNSPKKLILVQSPGDKDVNYEALELLLVGGAAPKADQPVE